MSVNALTVPLASVVRQVLIEIREFLEAVSDTADARIAVVAPLAHVAFDEVHAREKSAHDADTEIAGQILVRAVRTPARSDDVVPPSCVTVPAACVPMPRRVLALQHEVNTGEQAALPPPRTSFEYVL